jgi:hypothetical protein
MAIYRVQIGFQLDSALPKDMVTINPHYFGDNPQALGDALKVNLLALPVVATQVPFTIKVYDAQKAAPNYPLYTVSSGTGFKATAKPREVAICLSYYSTYNRPSYRGRLYIPGAFIAGTFDLRPSGGQITETLTWKNVIGKGLPSSHNWVVYSPKLNQSNGVSHVWVDDEWDTIRSRGLKSTVRTVQTLAS